MPFGLINAGAEYSRLMSKVVDWVDDPGFESYLDDEILHTPLPRPHLDLLRMSRWSSVLNFFSG